MKFRGQLVVTKNGLEQEIKIGLRLLAEFVPEALKFLRVGLEFVQAPVLQYVF